MITFAARLVGLSPVRPKGEEDPSWRLVLEVHPKVPVSELAGLLYTLAGFEVIEGQARLLPARHKISEGPPSRKEIELLPHQVLCESCHQNPAPRAIRFCDACLYPWACDQCVARYRQEFFLAEHKREMHAHDDAAQVPLPSQ